MGFSTSPSWWLDGDGKIAVIATGYDLYRFANCDIEVHTTSRERILVWLILIGIVALAIIGFARSS